MGSPGNTNFLPVYFLPSLIFFNKLFLKRVDE